MEEDKQEKQKKSSKLKENLDKGLKKAGETGKKVAIFLNNKVVKPTIQKVDSILETNKDNKLIMESFLKQSKEYTIIFLNKDKSKKKIHCIVDDENNLLKTTSNITNPNEVDYIVDVRNQKYYIEHIMNNTTPFKFIYKN